VLEDLRSRDELGFGVRACCQPSRGRKAQLDSCCHPPSSRIQGL